MKSGWIWHPDWKLYEENAETFLYFSKKTYFNIVPESFNIKISADSRYKLYINNQFCEAGPSKGDNKEWYYDIVDIAPLLRRGENTWSVIVLHYPLDSNKGNQSVFRTSTPGLYLESFERDKESGEAIVKTDESWRVWWASHIHIVPENPFFSPLQIYEHVKADRMICDWMCTDYSDKSWKNAKEYEENELSHQLKTVNLKERTIPLMRQIPGRFENVTKLPLAGSKEHWLRLLRGTGSVTIPANTEEIIEIDAGELMTGYLRLKVMGGCRTRIEMMQAECYVEYISEAPESYSDLPQKGDRTDYKNGQLTGFSDKYLVCGAGTEAQAEIYEPFWFRTFRYIQLKVKTGEEPIVIQEFDYLETGYPLQEVSNVEVSDPSLKAIWDISVRTLKRCMHETYEDCPFYEQLQYIMDTRSQCLYTYTVAGDDRLARRAMEDFKRSQREDGLLNACYPNIGMKQIPNFSIYYIGMLHDHMMYFGDKNFIRAHLSTVDRILDYFGNRLNEKGFVKKLGGLNRAGESWSFIDWTPEWEATTGVPGAILQGPITMDSFLYLYGLLHAEELCAYVGDEEKQQKYNKQGKALQEALNNYCRGDDGMYQDGPGCDIFSQHAQVFAILTDTVSVEEGKKYLLKTLKCKENYAQCSVAMMFYLFRALEKCELYSETQKLWEVWRNMIGNNMTTCAEDSLKSRSDCHAWGALALYELPSVILGVRPAAPGYAKVSVNPVTGTYEWAKGEVSTPQGKIYVNWKKKKGKLKISIETPANMGVECLE